MEIKKDEIGNGEPIYFDTYSNRDKTIENKLTKHEQQNSCMETSALHRAAKEGKLPAIKLLIDKGFNINIKNIEGKTPLFEASYWGREVAVKYLVEQGADIFCQTYKTGWLPIHAAAMRGHRTIVKYFLFQGVEVNVVDNDGGTPLFEASRWGQEAVVSFLISKRAEVSSRTITEQWQPIHVAAAKGHVTIVKLLLEYGTDIDTKNLDGRTALFEASYWGHDSVIRLLLNRKADINTKTNSECWLPIHAAAARGHPSIVELLFSSGMDIDAIGLDNRTPLFEAANCGKYNVVKLLVDKGANINLFTKNEGRYAIHIAAARGHLEVVEHLLSTGIDINISSFDGRTPLFEAACSGKDTVLRQLLDKGANIKSKTTEGWMPIHTAASKGHIKIVRILLDRGAEVNAKNLDDRTPLFESALSGHIDIVKLLMERGADITMTTKDEGRTALHAAAANGQREVVELLIEKGENVNVRSLKYKTPLYEAVSSNHYDTAKILLRRGANKYARTTWGETILEVARATGNSQIINLLNI